MKKQTLIIVANIFLIFLLFIFTEYAVYFIDKKFNHKYLGKTYPPFLLFKNEPSMDKYKKIFREPVGLENKKAPILMYGCSFSYGAYLEENDRPDYILSQLTQRPVYNFLYMLKVCYRLYIL